MQACVHDSSGSSAVGIPLALRAQHTDKRHITAATAPSAAEAEAAVEAAASSAAEAEAAVAVAAAGITALC
ncbi:unnamed protein product [Closterium sp. NIES-54]